MNDAHARALAPVLDTRYKQLAKRIQQLPPGGSRPLTVAGKVAGWITAKATSHLCDVPGVHIEPEAVHVTAVPRQRLPLNGVLAQLAASLKDTGCLRGWRNELLDVTAGDEKLGAIERAAVRPLGVLTRAVHLNAWTPDGRL